MAIHKLLSISHTLDDEIGKALDSFLQRGTFLLPSSDEFFSEFPILKSVTNLVEDALHELGGALLVKYQNRAPKDSIWITAEKTLCCRSTDDVFLLLKSSDRYQNIPRESFYIKFVEWRNDWDSKNEFRLFFTGGKIHALSQRDCTAVFPSLLKESDSIFTFITNSFKDIFSKDNSSIVEMLNCSIFKDYNIHSSDLSQNESIYDTNFFVDIYLDLIHETIFVIDSEPEYLCNDYLLFESSEKLHSSPPGCFLLVENEGDCRLGIFNQNILPVDLEQGDDFAEILGNLH